MAKASVVAARTANNLEELIAAVLRVEAQNAEILAILRPAVPVGTHPKPSAEDTAPVIEMSTPAEETAPRRAKRA